MYSLGEGDERFLVRSLSAINMDHSFVSLSSEDMCAGNGEAGGLGRGFLKRAIDGVRWVEGVCVDADVFCDCGVGCLWLCQDGRDEVF